MEDKEKKSSVSLAETYLRVIAKHSISLHLMSRDMNVAKINFQKLVELEGGKSKSDPDAQFRSDEEKEKSLSKEKEKLSPEKKKKEEEQKEKKKSLIPEKIGKKIEGIKGKAVNIFDKLKVLFSPKNFMKVLGKIALPLLILTTLWEGITGAWEAYKETGSLWEAFKGGIGKIVEFFTFGLIDKKMVSELFDNIADFFKPIVESVKTFFSDIGKWVGDKFDAVVSLFQTKEKTPKSDIKGQSELDKQSKELKKKQEEEYKKANEEAKKIDDAKKAAQKTPKEKHQERVEQAKQQKEAQKQQQAPSAPAPAAPAAAPAAPSKPTSAVSGGGKSGGAGASGDFSKNGNLATAKKGLNEAGITNNFAVNAALGNILKEVGKDAVPKTENLKSYGKTSNERIRKVFGSRASKFSDAELDKIKQNEVDFGEMVYGKDTKVGQQMGNSEVGDGYKYRGRGFIQITGKNLYAKYSKSTKIDLLNNPDLINTPEIAAKTMGIFLIDGVGLNKLNSFENQSQANRAVTQAIGGKSLDLSKGIGAEILGKVDKYSSEVGGVESSTAPAAAPSNAVTTSSGEPVKTGSGGYLTTTQKPTTEQPLSSVTQIQSGVDVNGINPELTKRVSAMAADFKQKTGKSLLITSGFRSNEKQKELYDDWKAGRLKAPVVAQPAPPLGNGRGSPHMKGLAFDINSKGQNGLNVLAGPRNKSTGWLESFGLIRPVAGEDWHIQLAGTPPGPDNPDKPGAPLPVPTKDGKAVDVASGKAENITPETPKPSEGSQISQESTSLASEQRQQQKPQTPIIVNAPTTNNTVVANNKNVNIPPKRNTAGALATAAS